MVSEEDGGVDGAFQIFVRWRIGITSQFPPEREANGSIGVCVSHSVELFVRDPPTFPDELAVDGTEERSDNHLVDVVGVYVLPLPALHRAVSDGTASRENINEVGRGRQQGDDALSECIL